MKKIQMLFAMLAIVTASAGVFATEITLDTQYYLDENDSGIHCDTPILGTDCSDSGSVVCEEEGKRVYKIVSGSMEGCEPVFKLTF